MINEKRGLFSIHGMTGFLIATIVLVVVVLSLAYLAYGAQVENCKNYYDVKDLDKVKMFDSQRSEHIIDVK